VTLTRKGQSDCNEEDRELLCKCENCVACHPHNKESVLLTRLDCGTSHEQRADHGRQTRIGLLIIESFGHFHPTKTVKSEQLCPSFNRFPDLKAGSDLKTVCFGAMPQLQYFYISHIYSTLDDALPLLASTTCSPLSHCYWLPSGGGSQTRSPALIWL